MSLESNEKLRAVVGGVLMGGATLAAALLGRRWSTPKSPWYRALRKPAFQPPAKWFGPIWGGLYALSAASGARVYAAPSSPARSKALALWGTQLVLNGAWSYLFFARKMPRWALADCAALLAATRAYRTEATKVAPIAGTLVLPYVAWVGFANALNEEIVRKNPHAGFVDHLLAASAS